MTINHKPENTTKTNEAHPSLGKARLEAKHVAAIREWLKDANSDAEKSHGTEKEFWKGQISAFELVIDLIHGNILDSDQICPFCKNELLNSYTNGDGEHICCECYEAMPELVQAEFWR